MHDIKNRETVVVVNELDEASNVLCGRDNDAKSSNFEKINVAWSNLDVMSLKGKLFSSKIAWQVV